MTGSKLSNDGKTPCGPLLENGRPHGAAPADEAFYDYSLPPALVAQHPDAQRDQARLLVVDRATGKIGHHVFHQIGRFLDARDLLVLNDTQVVPARLIGKREATGGQWEGLFVRALPDASWELLCQTRGRLREGEIVVTSPGSLRLQLLRQTADRHWIGRPLVADPSAQPFALLDEHGQVPLPPYIRKSRADARDRERYQTVYARRPGAVAAPTAGLHFTPELFAQLSERGIPWTFVTLHVGLGTFQPIKAADYKQHKMHQEWGDLSAEAVAAIAACRQRGGRVVPVGTTAVRVLEHVAATGPLRPWSGDIDLFIYPPYSFRVVDALITNFHLPRSSLLLLVSALAGGPLLARSYETAIAQNYRFYSYGDAMLVI